MITHCENARPSLSSHFAAGKFTTAGWSCVSFAVAHFSAVPGTAEGVAVGGVVLGDGLLSAGFAAAGQFTVTILDEPAPPSMDAIREPEEGPVVELVGAIVEGTAGCFFAAGVR